ncbi:MAG: Gfo/Idh/MocA family oxidoreductase [Bacilli bacterium]
MALRVGFIGAGAIARVHLGHVQNSGMAEVAAICDVNAEAAGQTAATHGASAYTDYRPSSFPWANCNARLNHGREELVMA